MPRPNDLALALGKTGDRAGERQALERSAQLDPKLALTQNQLGVLDLEDGKLDQAEHGFKSELSIDQKCCDFKARHLVGLADGNLPGTSIPQVAVRCRDNRYLHAVVPSVLTQPAMSKSLWPSGAYH